MAEIPRDIRELVHERSKVDDVSMCEASLWVAGHFICQGRATNIHHRINRSVGGGYDLSNLLDLCGSGTTGCHGWITTHPKLAGLQGLSLRGFSVDTERERVVYRGRWATLTNDGQVLYEASVKPLGRELF